MADKDQEKPKAPARVQLTSFCLYRVHGEPGSSGANIEVLAGASDARFSEGGKVQLLVASAPFHSDAFDRYQPKPGTGILALYGHRDAVEELHYWRSQARQKKAEFAYCEYMVRVDEINTQMISRDSLRENRNVRLFNLRRAARPLQQEIVARFGAYVKDAGGNPEKTMSEVKHVARRPDLFARLLEEDEDMRHLSVVVTPVADDPESPESMRSVAFVRAGSHIEGIVQGGTHYEMVLPNWMTDPEEAAKYRKQAMAGTAG